MRLSVILLALVTVLSIGSNPTVSGMVSGDASPLLRLGHSDHKEDKNDEERAGGTDIVKITHKLPSKDAKIVRQIAKGNPPGHTLTKLGVPSYIVNGHRVFDNSHSDLQLYLKWLKRKQDNPLTFPNKS